MRTPKRARLYFLAVISLLLFFCSTAFAWTGRVIGIADGDTLNVMHAGAPEKIRLYGIDCPEKDQPFGSRARVFTTRMVYNEYVEVSPVEKDRYGRTIAWVYLDEECLNEELLKAGLAWHYKQYSSDQKLANLEAEARQKRVGLWADPASIPPWDFRHGKRSGSAASDPSGQIVYHGNTRSHVFHQPGCKHYNCANCTVVFESRERALGAGYKPCGRCRP